MTELSDSSESNERPGIDWSMVVPPELKLSDFSSTERREWDAQNRFLERYALTKTRTSACVCAGVSQWKLRQWEREDIFCFAERLEFAAEAYVDMLEEKATELVMGLKPGQGSTLLIAKLNDGREQEVATIDIEKTTDSTAALEIRGNERVYGANHCRDSDRSSRASGTWSAS